MHGAILKLAAEKKQATSVLPLHFWQPAPVSTASVSQCTYWRLVGNKGNI